MAFYYCRIGDLFPVPYAETWENDLDKVLTLVRQAYTGLPGNVVQQWETWVANAPRNPSQSPMYVPFAKELFGLDENFNNGKDLTFFDGVRFTHDGNKSEGNIKSSTNVCVPNFAAPSDMTHYETAPSMAFGRVENDGSKTSRVPYKQIDANGKQIFASENDMNIQNNQKKKEKERV